MRRRGGISDACAEWVEHPWQRISQTLPAVLHQMPGHWVKAFFFKTIFFQDKKKSKQTHKMIDNVYKQTLSSKNNSLTTLQHTDHSEKYRTKHNVSDHSNTKTPYSTTKEIKQIKPKKYKDRTTHGKRQTHRKQQFTQKIQS